MVLASGLLQFLELFYSLAMEMSEVASHLKDADVKPTPQRMAITKYVLTEANHPTADDIFAWAKQTIANISLATVYNTLNALVAAGLLKEYRFGHSDKLIYDSNLDEHYHFLEIETGKLTDIPKESVTLTHQIQQGLEVDGFDILLYGKAKK